MIDLVKVFLPFFPHNREEAKRFLESIDPAAFVFARLRVEPGEYQVDKRSFTSLTVRHVKGSELTDDQLLWISKSKDNSSIDITALHPSAIRLDFQSMVVLQSLPLRDFELDVLHGGYTAVVRVRSPEKLDIDALSSCGDRYCIYRFSVVSLAGVEYRDNPRKRRKRKR